MSPTPAQRQALENIAARRRERTAAQIENLEWLLDVDNNAESVAVRAGFTNAAAAERALYRAGRPDLATRLRFYAGCRLREEVPA